MTAPSRIVTVVQARMGSSRLPGKVMAEIAGTPLIGHVLTRAAKARHVGATWLACSDRPADDPLATYAAGLGFPVFRGDEDNVLSRYAAVAAATQAEIVVRITGDCPMIDPEVIDAVIARFAEGGVDYASNALERSFPDGLDVEVFSRAALDRADKEATLPFLRAHVTPYIHGRLKDRLPWGGFQIATLRHPVDFSHLRWTVDEPNDLEFMRRLLPKLPADFRWQDAVGVLTREPLLLSFNSGIGLNEGTARDLSKYGHDVRPKPGFARSNALYDRALQTVPLASQTFSKSAQQWVKGATPLFLEHGRGCEIWDVDGNAYIDYVLGLLPIVLGYRDPDVDGAILDQLQRGIAFPLATPLEMELAERLVRLIPCAEMVRFGKNGSDATTAAVRLARAHTGRDKIALCGYHGWHDWYIGTTTRDLGVPEAVRNLSAKFPYNDADALEALLRADPNGFACVILEPTGTETPAPGFLERLRELTERYGVLLVFDEIVCGFRIDMGGAQKFHGVTPDLACFGKAIANGMPLSAIVGPRHIMRGMEDIFFSATFGGETLSLAAAIATLDKLERLDVPAKLARRGAGLMRRANEVFARHGLGESLSVHGSDWWPRIRIANGPVEAPLLNSLMRQECIANGLFLGASFNLCLAHDRDAVEDATIAMLDTAVAAVRDAVDSPDPAARLRGEPVRPVFAVR